MAKKEVYPEWKKQLWRGGRAFISGFLSSAGILLITTPAETFTTKENLINSVVPVLTGGLAGGFILLGKMLRDAFPEVGVLKKMPI